MKDFVSDPAIYAAPPQMSIVQKHAKEGPIGLRRVAMAISLLAMDTRLRLRDDFREFHKAVSARNEVEMNKAFEKLWGHIEFEPAFVMAAMLGMLDHYLHFLWYYEVQPHEPESKAHINEWCADMARTWACAHPKLNLNNRQLSCAIKWVLADVKLPPDVSAFVEEQISEKSKQMLLGTYDKTEASPPEAT